MTGGKHSDFVAGVPCLVVLYAAILMRPTERPSDALLPAARAAGYANTPIDATLSSLGYELLLRTDPTP